ncbi:MAG: carboxylating nicotinate-nucleotide diphosphorylase [Elusimicrobiota bacterium]
MKLNKKQINKIVENALKEDISKGDITSELVIPKEKRAEAEIFARQSGILCGTSIAEAVFKKISKKLDMKILKKDGEKINKEDKIIDIQGTSRDILKGERTALNFLSHLSGIATLTQKFVEQVRKENSATKVMDTRKTVPGMRSIEKYAVRTGGGTNHRMSLSDGILIKENHIALQDQGIKEIIGKIQNKHIGRKDIEIEVKNLYQLKKIGKSKINIVMLDNFCINDIKKAVKIIKNMNPEIVIEVSGGVNLENIRNIAKTGVHRISSGKLTSSAPALDFSLLVK